MIMIFIIIFEHRSNRRSIDNNFSESVHRTEFENNHFDDKSCRINKLQFPTSFIHISLIMYLPPPFFVQL